ncbi:MAG: NAD-dependent epimerase/dehydratase family protein [Latilactobacillus curvatus]
MLEEKILEEDINKTIIDNKSLLDNFRNKKVLVTGVTGLIARILVLTLLEANKQLNLNIEIIGLARNKVKCEKLFDAYKKDENLSFIYQDIRENINLEKSVDFIFHAAAVTSSQLLIEKPIESFETQVIGTLNILNYADKSKAKVLYFSSMEIYGKPFLDELTTEDKLGYVDPLVLRNGYPEAKRADEFLGKAFSEERGVFVVNARLAQTFGPGIQYDDSRVFAQFIRGAIAKEDLVLHTDGSSMGNYCYLRDTIEAILMLIIKGKSGESYNVVNEETNVTIKQMAEIVSKEFGNGNVVIDIPNTDMGYAPKVNLHLSSSKIKKLGWRPTYGLNEMFARTIESFRE